MKRIISLVIVCVMAFAMFTLTGCQSQADRVSYNISKEADNFNVIRRLSVINARTDKPVFELIAAFSFELQSNRIIATCEVGDGVYKKHSIGLNEWTIWFIEDVSGANVNKYRYEVNFLPEMLVPVTITTND